MASTKAAGELTIKPLVGSDQAIRRWAGSIAAVTRQAYAGSDPVPGLPPPDGSMETAADVAAELRAGTTAWLGLDRDGALAGVIQVRDRGRDGWEVRRVATAPSSKRLGVGPRILREVEQAAASARAPRVWLNAVVERCLPPFYARLGYHVIDCFPSPDKLLTELTMERDPATVRRAEPFPWTRVRPPRGPVICWFTVDRAPWLVIVPEAPSMLHAARTAVTQLAAAGAAGGRLAGMDVLPDGGLPLDSGLLPDGGIMRAGDDRLSVRRHVAPRTVHAGLLAFWRTPPGLEAEVPTA